MKVLGLDIGTHTLRGLHLTRTMRESLPSRSFEVSLAGRSVQDVLIEVLPQEIAGVDVLVISLPRQDVKVRQFNLPLHTTEQLALTVPAEAEGHLGIPLEKMNLDWLLVSKDPARGSDVIVFALPRSVIDERLALIEESGLAGLAAPITGGVRTGLSGRRMEVLAYIDSVGLVNAFLAHQSRGEPVSDATAIVDIGAAKTCVEVVHGGRLIFSRSIGVAGDAFTQAVAAATSLDEVRAEEVKRMLGVQGEAATGLPPPALSAMKQALVDRYKRLAQELRRTMMAVRDQYPDVKVGGVHVTGGGAKSIALLQVLGQSLDVPVQPLVLPHLDGLPGVDPAMPPAAAYGLALMGANRARIVIDPVRRPRNWLRLYGTQVALAAGAVVCMLVLQFALVWYDLSRARHRTRELDTTCVEMLKDLNSRPGEKIGLKDIDARAVKFSHQLDALADDLRSPIGLMERLATAKPASEELVVNGVVADRERMVLDGYCDGYKTVQDFENGLRQQFKEGDVGEELMGNRAGPDGRSMLMFRLIVTYKRAKSAGGGGGEGRRPDDGDGLGRTGARPSARGPRDDSRPGPLPGVRVGCDRRHAG